MSEIDATDIGARIGESDPIGLENPVVSPGFDPGLNDRVPKKEGDDTSMPDTRFGLRNEARTRAFSRKRDVTLLDQLSLI